MNNGQFSAPTPRSGLTAQASTSQHTSDLLFGVLSFFRSSDVSELANNIQPANWGVSHHDTIVSWVLHELFKAIALDSMLDNGLFCEQTAAHLEDLGLWPWSIFVLQHQSDTTQRDMSIQSVLDRYADCLYSEEQINFDGVDMDTAEFLQTKLRIPSSWVTAAILQAAESRCDHLKQAKCLGHLLRYSKLEALAINKLAVKAVVNEDQAYVEALEQALVFLSQNKRLRDPIAIMLHHYVTQNTPEDESVVARGLEKLSSNFKAEPSFL